MAGPTLPWDGGSLPFNVSHSHSTEKSHGGWSLLTEYHSWEVCLDSQLCNDGWFVEDNALRQCNALMTYWFWLGASKLEVQSLCYHHDEKSTEYLSVAVKYPSNERIVASVWLFSNVTFAMAPHPEDFPALLNKWRAHLSNLRLPPFILRTVTDRGHEVQNFYLSKH